MNPGLILEIGGTPVHLHLSDSVLLDAIKITYANFVKPAVLNPIELHIETGVDGFIDPSEVPADSHLNVSVSFAEGRWQFGRYDFRADWSPSTGKGRVQQGRHAASIDAVLRMVHSIMSVRRGGFLLHAASSVRNGYASVFSGVSGAGKTTISSLLPPGATLLTDEISYILPGPDGYRAFGTPFAGNLGIAGPNDSFPLKAVYLLAKGPVNKIESIDRKLAPAAILRNVLFFWNDPELIAKVFETVCRLADSVPVLRLTFAPTPEVWETIP